MSMPIMSEGEFEILANDLRLESAKASTDRMINKAINEVMSQREEILRAFVAKYGYEPERAVQVEQRMPDGTTRWFVRRRNDEEMANESMMGAQL